MAQLPPPVARNPIWEMDPFLLYPRDVLEVGNRCLCCLAGECRQHNYYDTELSNLLRSNSHLSPDEALGVLGGDHAYRYLTRGEQRLPTEIIRQIIRELPPVAFFALADIEPFRGILAENPNHVGANLPWGDTYPEAMEQFPREPQQFTQAPGGLLFGNISDRDYYVFLDRITLATDLIVDRVSMLLETHRQNLGRHRLRKLIWHLWRFFATTNTIQVGPARDQEPWDYIGGLSPNTIYFIRKGINALAQCLIESYSLEWPTSIPEHWHIELEELRMGEKLARFIVLEWLRRGMRKVRQDLMGTPTTRPQYPDMSYAFNFNEHLPSGRYEDRGTPWQDQWSSRIGAAIFDTNPRDHICVSPDTYRLKFMGVPGVDPSRGDAYGCIDMIPPWPDLIFALKRAQTLKRRQLANQIPNGVLIWANWCQVNPGGYTVERVERPLSDGLHRYRRRHGSGFDFAF